jgi:hypothetical protein
VKTDDSLSSLLKTDDSLSSLLWLRRLFKSKLGSNLGPLAAEYRDETGWNTQNKPKRDNRLVNRLLVRDQGVGGSNPLSPTKAFRISYLGANFCVSGPG